MYKYSSGFGACGTFALELSKDKNISLRKACKIASERFGHHVESIRTAARNLSSVKTKIHGNQLFTIDEEMAIVSLVSAFSRKKTPLQPKEIIDIVKRRFKKQDSWNGCQWFAGFKKRWKKQIKIRTVSPIQPERLSQSTREDVDRFTEQMDWVNEKYSFQGKYIINADESRADSPYYQRFKAIFENGAQKCDSVFPHKDSLYTVLPFCGSDGTIWLVLLVYKGSERADGYIYMDNVPISRRQPKTRGSFSIFYAVTDTGFMKDDLWNHVCHLLISILKPQLNGAHALLIIDNCSVHTAEDTLFDLHENNIVTIFLPPHTTHWSQPLDNGCFAPLRVLAKKFHRQKLLGPITSGKVPNNIVGEIITESIRYASTKKVISSSFVNTALVPWNKKLFMEKFEISMGNLAPNAPSEQQQQIDRLTSCALSMIKEHSNDTNGQTSRVRRVKKMNQCYSPEKMYNEDQELMTTITERKRKRKEIEEKIKEIRKERKEMKKKADEEALEKLNELVYRGCKGKCGKTCRNGSSWFKCELCGIFYVCAQCQKKPNLVSYHQEVYINDSNDND